MYLLDPDRGRRRRALVRDKLVSVRHQLDDAAEVTATDVLNRGRGQVARLRSLVTGKTPSDEAIAHRIRSELRFVVRHPRSVEVEVQDGRVTLSGPVLADEVDHVLSVASSVAGVKTVDNHLTVHREPGNVPGLQGEPAPRRRTWLPWYQRVWSPAQRLGAGLFGVIVAMWGMRRRDVIGTVIALGGVSVLARAGSNVPMRELLDMATGHESVSGQTRVAG